MEDIKIETVEDAILYTSRDIESLKAFDLLKGEDAEYYKACYSLNVVIEALNKKHNGGVYWKPFVGKNETWNLTTFIIGNNPDKVKIYGTLIEVCGGLVARGPVKQVVLSSRVASDLKPFEYLIKQVYTGRKN